MGRQQQQNADYGAVENSNHTNGNNNNGTKDSKKKKNNNSSDMVSQQQVDTTPRPMVTASQTVPPRVNWEERQFTDKFWALIYVACLISFLACGFTLVARAHPRYEFNEATVIAGTINDISIFEDIEVRVVSEHYKADVEKCCANIINNKNNNNNPILGGNSNNDDVSSSWGRGLCDELTVDNAVRKRRLLVMEQERQRRRLQEGNPGDDDDLDLTTFGNLSLQKSKLERGDGMFDAFLDAPYIPVTLCFFGLFLALTWIVLLRFFATPIVFATEAIKVAFFLYLTIQYVQLGLTGAAVVAIICALAVIAWGIYVRKQLVFAGKMLSYAAQSFKENMELFCAFLPILVLYAINAYLFVTFYAKSFDVVEVKEWTVCRSDLEDFGWTGAGGPPEGAGAEQEQDICYSSCRYESPSYTTGMVVYLALAYLWSVLLFSMMRLSIIAHVIGSWHFHPHNPPSIGRAIWNTCTTSMGTLSAASLIATIADKLNRIFLEQSLWRQCLNPIFCILMPLYCLCGHCIRMFILMLTKFSVILHVFTGKSWLGSAKKVFKILKRHFKGGFVTEYASSSVLNLGSYVFSIGIYFVAWVWLDREFKTDTFIGVSDSTVLIVAWILFALFNIWYPVLGIYLLIIINRLLSSIEVIDPAHWVTPFAATFIGCIAMMFFTYLAGIFLDTVDVCFLCFAIDRDNNVDLSNDEFAKLVNEGVDTVITHPDWSDNDDDDEESPPRLPVVVTGLEPMQPPINNNNNNNNNNNTSKEQEMTA